MRPEVEDYWVPSCENVFDDFGLSLPADKMKEFAEAMAGCAEQEGHYTGREIADANVRAMNDEAAMEKVLAFIEKRMRIIDKGPAGMFSSMSHDQKMAMAELFQARKFLKAGQP